MSRTSPPTARVIVPASRSARSRRALLLLREVRELAVIAGPIIISQLGGIAMTTVDTIMVAPLGADSLAAAGLGSALHQFLLMICTGLILGMAPLVSQAFGAGELAKCNRTLVQGLWMALFLAVPITWISYEGEFFARALAQGPEVTRLVGSYLRPLAWGVPPMLLFIAFRQYLEAMGRTSPPMLITFFGVALNIVATRILIFGIDGVIAPMWVAGAAWATTLVRWAMLLIMVGYLFRGRGPHPFAGASRRLNAPLLRTILRVGGPIGAQLGAEVGIFAFAAVMMGWLGADELAAHNVTLNLAATTFMVGLGVSLAGSIRVGQHIGGRRPLAMRRAVISTYLLAMGFMGAAALAFLVIPEILIGIYTSEPAILRIGTTLLFMAAVFQLFDAAQVAGLCALRGAADTRVPMLITILGYWVVGLPAAYLLGFRTSLGPAGIWAGLSISLLVVAVLLAWRVRRVLWRAVPPRPALAPAA